MAIYRVRHTHGDNGEGGESNYIFRSDNPNILQDPNLEEKVIELLSITYEPEEADEIEITLEGDYDELPNLD